MIVSITIWIIGYLFCLGLFDKEIRSDGALVKIIFYLCEFLLWPWSLGFAIYNFLEEKLK